MQLTTAAILKTFAQLNCRVVIADHSFLFQFYLFAVSPASVPATIQASLFGSWEIGVAALD